MTPVEMQKALERFGPMTQDWLTPQRNAAGICEALCVDWLSKQLPLLSAAQAPSERGNARLGELQTLLEDKKVMAATRVNQKAAAKKTASEEFVVSVKAKTNDVLTALEERYKSLGVTSRRKPFGPFQSLERDEDVRGTSSMLASLYEVDDAVSGLERALNKYTKAAQDTLSESQGIHAKWNQLSDAEKARKGYKHVFRDQADSIRTLKAVSCIGRQYPSASEFASDLARQPFALNTAWLIALDTPDERHAMICYRGEADYLVLEPNFGLYKMKQSWPEAIPHLTAFYQCRRHNHRATSFNRVNS